MDELISRKALLAEYDRVHIGEPGKARKLIEDAPRVDAVDLPMWATETAYKNGYEQGMKDAVKWISVKDRLPDLELVEVKTDDNDLFPCLAVRKHPRAKNGKYTAKVWYDGYGFIDGISNDVTDEVTHWMPLPEPPKEA